MDSFLYTPKDYEPAIHLALNYYAGGLVIHDYYYDEALDIWHVHLEQGNYRDYGFVLQGPFVRSCWRAVKRGIISWSKPAEN